MNIKQRLVPKLQSQSILTMVACVLVLVVTSITLAQSIDPTNDRIVTHLHPQHNIIGVTDGYVFETYTLDYSPLNQLTLIDDPSINVLQRNFVWSPDGSKLAIILAGLPVPTTTRVLQIWDMTNTQKLYELSSIDGASIAWSPDSTRFAALVATGSNERVARTYNAQSGQNQIQVPAGIQSRLVWSPQGNQLITEGIVPVVWSADSGQQLRQLEVSIDTDVDLTFSPTANFLALVNLNSGQEVIEIWNTDTGQLVHQLQGHTGFVSDIVWTTGGLVSTGVDNFIRIWDPQTGQQIRAFQVGLYPEAELNADGTRLLVTDRTTGVHTRDAVTGEILAVFGETTACDATIPVSDSAALTGAITTANGNGTADTICLTQSNYNLTAVNNTTDGPNGLPSIATDITIVGNGATISRDPAAPAFRIFHVAAGGSLTLDGVTISGGSATSAAPGNDGGAIYSRGTVNLTGSTSITNSTASADGGAVYNRGTFTVEAGSSIAGNTAADDGGGLYTSSGTLNVTGGTITDNTADDEGGGIRSVDSAITLTNANITDNTATGGSGGGLYTTSTTLTVTGSVFSGNGGNSGGGLYFTNSPSAALLDGVQILNNTGTNGGGLYLTSSGQAALTNVTVSGNQATSSAAGIWSGGTLTLTGSTVSNNGNTSQPGSAGGIRAAGATLTVNDTVISGNLVNSSSGSGAGVYIASAGNIVINGGEISANDARNGGALYNSGSLSLSSIIDDNTAQHYGGGLYITGGTTHVDGSVFSNNSAIDRGGAVYNGVTTISWIHDSCITGNTSADTGGVYSNTAAFDATDNWWGTASGPSGAGTGTGDAANSNVTFSPFLTAGCPPGTGEGGAQQLMGPQVQMRSSTPTPVDPVRVPFNATFEDELDWYAGGTWVLDTLNGHTNAPSWMVNTSSRGEESILEMRAPVDLRGPRSPRLTFWERGQIASSDVVMVEVLPEGASTWSVIDIRSTVPNVWTQRSVSLSAYRGQTIRLRVRVVAGGELEDGTRSTGLWIDDWGIESR
jgi:hypothetical protein